MKLMGPATPAKMEHHITRLFRSVYAMKPIMNFGMEINVWSAIILSTGTTQIYSAQIAPLNKYMISKREFVHIAPKKTHTIMGSIVQYVHTHNIITLQLTHVNPVPLAMSTIRKRCYVCALMIIPSQQKMDAFNATSPITFKLNLNHVFLALRINCLTLKKEFVCTAQQISLS